MFTQCFLPQDSSVVCPVGGGGLGQCDGDSSSNWHMWINQLQRNGPQPVRRQGKASEIVMRGPVGDIARTDGTELGRIFLDYIMRVGWIDIAGQCANTISVRNGACGM